MIIVLIVALLMIIMFNGGKKRKIYRKNGDRLCNSETHSEYNCVETGDIEIDIKPLITHYVNTCSVITMKNGKYYLLGHIDEFKENMKKELISKIKMYGEYKNSEIKVYIGKGCEKECDSFKIIKEVLEMYGIFDRTKIERIKTGTVWIN